MKYFLKQLSLVLFSVLLLSTSAVAQSAENILEECPYKGVSVTQEQLREILIDHENWRVNEGGQRANLCDADLRGANLKDTVLFEANLRGAILDYANLKGADLRSANLKDAALYEANLRGVYLSKANLVNANLRQADLEGAKLILANLKGSYLHGANLKDADFTGANLKGVDLSSANMEGIHLSGANMESAYLLGAILQGVDLSSANLLDADLSGANLRSADLRDANLKGVNLSYADLEGADLRLSIWSRKPSIENGIFKGVILNNTDLSGVLLRQVNFEGALFRDANLQNTSFDGSILTRADFSGADLRGAKLQFTRLEGASFNSSKLQNANFLGVPLNELKLFEDLIETEDFPTGLVSVREKFKASGDQEEERYLTKLIKTDNYAEANIIENTFNRIFFDLPSAWGSDPGRPLYILGGLIILFGFTYIYPISRRQDANLKSGLYVISPAGSLVEERSPFQRTTFSYEDKVERLYRENILNILGYAFYFSILSAFHIGWRDLNVGNWIARLQPRETILRPRGWVRVVSGIQSLMSVYLLALWALVYFGRPFN